MRKELSAGFIAFIVLIVIGFLLEYHPLAYVMLSILTAAVLVSNTPFYITSEEIAERYELMENELELKNRVVVENEALRDEVESLEHRIKVLNDVCKIHVFVQNELNSSYEYLKSELEALEVDRKKGLFDRQKLFNLKAEHLNKEGDVKS